MSESAVYEGVVRHHRSKPIVHAFEYRVFLLYLDLAELPDVLALAPLASATRPALAWFRRADHFGDRHTPLDLAVRKLVEERTGKRPLGAIRLLTHLRYFGYVFNPVSFFYCFEPTGALEAVVAEIDNTPWGERHLYVLDARDSVERDAFHFRFPKGFHVSPFMAMDLVYDWRFGVPAERLKVEMQSEERGEIVFDATLALRRRALDATTLARAITRYPAMTARVMGAIYWQALRLWRKGAPVFSHPKHEARG
jgi:uncharacterized protein